MSSAKSDQDAPKLILKEWEVICDKCNGSGNDPEPTEETWFKLPCPKCQGEKKVDWLSNITGVKEKEPEFIIGPGTLTLDPAYTTSTLNLDGDIQINGKDIEDYVREIASQELAAIIDREVLRILKKEQQNNKRRRTFFDNRIFSKFMFLDYFK